MTCQTPPPPPPPAPVVRRHRGSVLVYTVVTMVTLCGLVSLAVDYGHVQSVRQQMQRSADSAARGYLDLILRTGYTPALALADAAYFAQSSYNPVDAASVAPATVTITPGTWDPTTATFIPAANSTTGVRVVICRHGASGNGVPLYFGKLAGRPTCDVNVTAIAYAATTANATVGGQSDPWLADVTNGASVSDGDVAPNQSPPMVTQVTPGDTITFTNVTANGGGVSHAAGLAPQGPNGATAAIYSHNCDDPLGEPAVQNNIGDVKAPIDALMGLFLTNNAPNTQPAPTTVLDYTTQAARDQVATVNLQNQQPFFIGTGQTTAGVTKTYTVPAGCTRLYLGIMDGHQWSNNSGSFGVTINHGNGIKLVQ